MAVSVVDLFCGVGGMTHGFIRKRFGVVAGVDIDSLCKYPYEANNRGAVFHQLDLLQAPIDQIAALFPPEDTKILIGCAPCQPYSKGARAKRRKDDMWKLIPRFAEIVESIQPTIVSMENVPDLKNFQDGKIYKDFVHCLERNGYHVWQDVVYCPDYGVPQTRERLVLIASKLGNIQMIAPTVKEKNYPTVRKAIGKLPPIAAGEQHKSDPLHRSRDLKPINLQRIQQSRPDGTWEDWDEGLRAACHRKASGASYTSVYGRMSWEKPAPTITTQAHSFGSGRFGHPEQDRALSLREMALLQTFPRKYVFVNPSARMNIDRTAELIGNAVPVLLGEAIAESIKAHLQAYGYPFN
jgi:DNA (cytosine-5)-methyltransferase 1